jgi:cytochrome c-type biogenesis protein CcmH
VLLKPRFSAHTLLLWLAPLGVLIIAAIAFFAAARRGKVTAGESRLTADEEARLATLVKD